MGEELKIQIIGSLNTDKSTLEINKAIAGIEKKIQSLKLNIHVDEKISKTLNDFALAMENQKKISQDLNKVLKEEQTIIKNLDGSVEKLTKKYHANNEITEKTTRTIDNRKKATQQETNAIAKQISELEKLGSIQKRVSKTDSSGNRNGGSETYKNGSTDTTYNYDKVGNVTSSKSTENIDKERLATEQLIEAKKRLQIEVKRLNSEGVITASSLGRLNSSIDNTKNIAQVKRLEDALKRTDIQSNTKNSLNTYKQQAQLNVQNLTRTHGTNIDDAGVKAYLSSVNALSSRTPNLSKQMATLNMNFKQLSANAKDVSHQANIAGQSLGSMLTQAAVKFPLWMGISTVFYTAVHSVTALVDTLYTLDERLVSIQKVSDNANMAKVWDDASTAAFKYGQTIDQALASYEAVAKLGYDQQDATVLSDSSMLLATVGEFKDAAEATEYLTAITKQYKLEVSDTGTIVDSLNNLSNKSGADTISLAQGLSKASSSAAMAKVNFHELSGMIATTQETLHITGNEAGTFYKSLFSRFLRPETQKTIQGIGVAVKDDLTGNLRSATDVLADVGDKWEDLDEITKNAVASQLGGGWHVNKVTSLLENQAAVVKNTSSSLNSYGSATKELSTFQDGLQFKTNEMTSSFQELSMTIGEAGVRSAIVSFLETVTFMTKGFAELTEATDGWNIKLPLLAAGVYGGVKALSALRLAITGVKASLGWIGLGVVAVELLASTFMSSASAADLNTEALTENAKATSDHATELEKLIAQYDELKPQAEGNTEKQKDLKSVLQQIQQIAPQIIDSTGDYGEALDLNRQKADHYVASLKEMTKEQLAQATTANSIEISAVTVDIDEAKKQLEEMDSSVKESFSNIESYQLKYDVSGLVDAEKEFRDRIGNISEEIGKQTAKGNNAMAESLKADLTKATNEYEKYIGVMKDSGGKLAEYSETVGKLQELEGKKDGLDQRQKAMDEMANATSKSSTANQENADSLANVDAKAQDSLTAISSTEDAMGDAASATTEAKSAYEEYSDSLQESIGMENQKASASEMLAGITSSQIDQIYEQVAVYQLLSKQENLNEQQKLMLADATNFLAGIYPYLVQGSEANIDAILRETKANDILLEAVNMSAQGQLSSQENQTLNSALGAKSRIEVIKAEIVAVDKMVQAYKQAAIDTYNAAVAIGNDIGTLEAEKSYKRADALGDSRISSLNSELDALIPKFEKYTGTLGKSIDYQGRASEAQAKSAKATDKNKKSTEKAIDATEDYVFIESKLNKELDKNNQLLEKNASKLSTYAKNSKEYRKTLEKEIKLLKEKNKIIDKGISSIDAQIKADKYITEGVVNKDEAVKDTFYGSSSSSKTTTKKSYTGKYAKQINSSAKKYGVDPFLIAAMIQQESRFNSKAVSSAGAKGLMQLMPGTAREMGVKNPFDVTQNINGGTKYIAQQLAKYNGNIQKALYAYNAGAGNVTKILKSGSGSWKEPKNYYKKVTGYLKDFVAKATKTSTGATKSSVSTKSSKSNTSRKVTSSDVASYYMDGFYITDGFNARGGTHKGLDLNKKGTTGNGDTGTLIKNIASGTVETIFKNNPTAGNAVIVRGDDGKLYQYNHLHKAPTVKVGQKVSAGQKIGLLGNTGASSGAHLDLKIKDSKGNYIDPEKYLKKLAKDSSGTIELTDSSSSTSRKTIKKGSSGSDVKALQKALGIPADGIFGKATEKAVKAYQKKNGLTADGIVGADTWSKINKKTSDDNKKKAENKQNKADAKAEKAKLKQDKDKNNQEIQEIYRAIAESWASPTNKEINLQQNVDRKRNRAEENGVTSKKGRAYLKEENKELKKLEKEQKARLKDLQNYYQKNKGSMSQATRAEWNKLVPELQADILATQKAQQESLLDFFQATSDAYDKEADALQKKADAKQAKADKLDPNSKLYRNYLREEVGLLDQVEKKQKNKIKNLKDYYKKNKADMDQATRDSINLMVDTAVAELAEIKNAIKEINKEIQQSNLDAYLAGFEKSDSKTSRQLRDIDDKIALTDEDNQKELLRLNDIRAKKLLEQRKAALNHIADLKKMRKELKGNAEALKQNSEEIQNYTDQVKDLNLELHDQKELMEQMYNDIADEYISAMKEAYEAEQTVKLKQLEKIRKAEEKAHTDKMKLLEDEGKKLDELYDKRLREIDDKEDEDSYNKELTAKQKEAQEIQKKINKLSMDDSTWAKKERAALQEELASKEEEINDLIHDRNLDLRKQSLSDEKDALDKSLSERQEAEDEAWTNRQEQLDEQEEALNLHYENLLNDERYWNQVRQDILNGDIQQYKDKLTEMGKFIAANSEDIGQSISNNIVDTLKGANEALSAITIGFDELAKSIDATTAAQDKAAAKAEADRIKKEAEEKAKAEKEKNRQDMINKVDDFIASPPIAGTITTTPDSLKNPSFGLIKDKDPKTTDNLNLRKSAAFGDNIILTIPKGKTVDYLSDSNGWAKVKYGGKTGYVSKSYLQFKSGGYTGDDEGLAMLHKKEQVLNAKDTEYLFKTVDTLNSSDILETINQLSNSIKLPNLNTLIKQNQPPSTGGETYITIPEINVYETKNAKDTSNEVFKILNNRLGGKGLR